MAWLSRETGVPASSLTSYRKGSIPAADAAFRLADALGVDARWLITGQGTPHPARSEPNHSVRDVKSRLDEIEARLHELTDVRAEVHGPEFAGVRDELAAVATAEVLPETLRARADLILRLAYEDSEAEARQERRVRRFRAEQRRQELVLDDAIAEIGWTPPPTAREVLRGLAAQHGVDREGLTVVLREMQRLSGQAQAQLQQ